jgi:hypothetical protein
VIKNGVVVIVCSREKNEKLATDIKEKNECAESSGMAGQMDYDVLSQCLGRPEQPVCVCGVSSYQDWKYAWPKHASMHVQEEKKNEDRYISFLSERCGEKPPGNKKYII